MLSKKFLIFFIFSINFLVATDCPEQKPFLCADKTCATNAENCDGFEGCTNTLKPYLCSDGQCAKKFKDCTKKVFQCEIFPQQKCADGVCRKNCAEVPYSSCTFGAPIRCADGSCVNSVIECASYKCPGNAPFRCKDNRCVTSISGCKYPLNILIVKKMFLEQKNESRKVQLLSQNNFPVGHIAIPSNQQLNIKGVPLSSLKNTQMQVQTHKEKIYQNFFFEMPENIDQKKFIRSAIVQISSIFEQKVKFEPSLTIFLNIDILEPLENIDEINRSNLYCLAELIDNQWICTSQKEAIQAQKFGEYSISTSGTFAVIFSPDSTTPTYEKGAYCGFLCQNKKFFVIFWILIVPVLLLIFLIMFKLYRLQTQVLNVSTENFFLKNKMIEIENVQIDFTGQTILEKIDEGVQYFANALRNEEQESIDEFKVLNLKLTKIKDQARNLNTKRNKLIYSNKEKLEDIRKLRNKLGEYA